MNTRPERLDKDGFPIPAGFDTYDPAGPSAGPSPGRRGGGLLRLSRWLVLAGLLTAAWFYFDVGRKVRTAVGDYLLQKAVGQYFQNDLEGALRSLNRAVSWSPKNGKAVVVRMLVHLELKNFQPALDDSFRAAELLGDDESWISGRLEALHGLNQQRELAAFCSRMLDLGLADRRMLLNTRAYARAIGEFELEEGLVDIREVLDDGADEVDDEANGDGADDGPARGKPVPGQRAGGKGPQAAGALKNGAPKNGAGKNEPAKPGAVKREEDEGFFGLKVFERQEGDGVAPAFRRLLMGKSRTKAERNPENASYIDTRGYLLLKLGKAREALADFENSIALMDILILQLQADGELADENQITQAQIDRRLRRLEESQAVIHHHRGEALERLGRRAEAEKAYELARQMGFDMQRGVY